MVVLTGSMYRKEYTELSTETMKGREKKGGNVDYKKTAFVIGSK